MGQDCPDSVHCKFAPMMLGYEAVVTGCVCSPVSTTIHSLRQPLASRVFARCHGVSAFGIGYQQKRVS